MTPLRGSARLLLAAILLASAGACGDDPAGQCVCTEEFRVYTLVVLDDAQQPVSNATLTITNLRTGRGLTSGWLGLLAPGYYAVADDGMLEEFSDEGDAVRVTGQSASGDFTADFVFAPDPCRCHLLRIAGPDTVVIGEPPP